MPARLLIPKRKTTCTMEFSTYEKVKATARMLHKSNSEVIEMSVLTGIEVLSMALNPKNATFLKEIGEKYPDELATS